MFEDPARDVLTPSQLNTLAVSYTHLDVYKRQAQVEQGRTTEGDGREYRFAPAPVKQQRQHDKHVDQDHAFVAQLRNEDEKPVSYTHLDVYKRQDMKRLERATCCCSSLSRRSGQSQCSTGIVRPDFLK